MESARPASIRLEPRIWRLVALLVARGSASACDVVVEFIKIPTSNQTRAKDLEKSFLGGASGSSKPPRLPHKGKGSRKELSWRDTQRVPVPLQTSPVSASD